MKTGYKVLIGVGAGLFLLRSFGQNIIDQRVFDAALKSTNRTEIAQAEAFFRAKGDNVRADVLQARLNNLPR